MRSRKWLNAGVAVAVAAAIAGCGGDDDDDDSGSGGFEGEQGEVAGSVEDLIAASDERDVAKICGELFTAELAQQAAARKGTCEQQVEQELIAQAATFEIVDVRVEGNQAVVKVREPSGAESLVGLERSEGAWRIARIRNP